MSSISVRSLCANFLALALTAEALRSNVIPGRFFVEFEDDADHTLFSNLMKRDSISAVPILTTESAAFKGASYKIDVSALGEDPISVLSEMPAIKNIWPVEKIERPKDEIAWTGSDIESAPESVKKQVLRADEGFSSHLLTQVDKLHAENITGKGIKIGIVDDGIDYKHPALGGGFGPNHLVVRGYDHIGDEYNPFSGEDPIPDDDPYADCDGHGTHVAGIIAAQENEYGFVGSAPGVELGIYRVFSCAGYTTTDVVAAGFNKAFDDGNDIITASLGGMSGWSEAVLSVVAQRLADKGAILTVAQGNSGNLGPFFTESPASGLDVLGIGSIGNSEIGRVGVNGSYSTDNSTSKNFIWTPGVQKDWGNNVSLPLYIGDGKACDEFSKAENLTGHIVLFLDDPNCADWYKASFAAAKGAKYALVYRAGAENTRVLDFNVGSGDPLPIGIGSIPESTARMFQELAKSGKEITLQITDPKYAKQFVDEVPNPAGGYMSPYSTWGPTFELDLKPDVSAPGGFILSTWPVSKGGYAVISGTSMATPLTAGVIALILEARGNTTAAEIRKLLTTTSRPITYINTDNTPLKDLAPVPQQGGGVIQAHNAAHSTSWLSVSKLILNDTANFIGNHEFTVKNTGKVEITYAITHASTPTFYTFNKGSKTPAVPKDLEFVNSNATVLLSVTNATVAPGAEFKIAVEFVQPADVDTKRLPVYSGYIQISGTTGDLLSIPYIGVASAMKDVSLLDKTILLQPANGGPWPNPATQGFEYTLPINANGSWSEPPPNVTVRYIFPQFYTMLPFGIPRTELEVWSVNPNNTKGVNASSELVKNYGLLPGYPEFYVPRTVELLDNWNGTLKDGTRVPTGNYTLIFKALKVLGDASKEGDWETQRTVDFGLRYM